MLLFIIHFIVIVHNDSIALEALFMCVFSLCSCFDVERDRVELLLIEKINVLTL